AQARVDAVEKGAFSGWCLDLRCQTFEVCPGRTRHGVDAPAVLRPLKAQADTCEVGIGLAQPRTVGGRIDADGPVLVFAHAAHIQLGRLPWPQAVLKRFGKYRRVAGRLAGLPGQEAGSLVIPVAVAIVALEARDHDERALRADDADHVAQDLLAAPFHQRLLQPFREAVVDHAGEVLPVDAVVLVRAQELLGPNQAQRIEQLRADRVVARLAARQREQRYTRTIAAAEHRQHAALFVVGVRGRVEHARGGAQLEQLLPGAGGAPILRQRLDRLRRRHGRNHRTGDNYS